MMKSSILGLVLLVIAVTEGQLNFPYMIGHDDPNSCDTIADIIAVSSETLPLAQVDYVLALKTGSPTLVYGKPSYGYPGCLDRSVPFLQFFRNDGYTATRYFDD
jgi:hypothetical protein